jgi:hypothetical protein
LDLFDHYVFQFFQVFSKKALGLYRKTPLLLKLNFGRHDSYSRVGFKKKKQIMANNDFYSFIVFA